MELLEGHLKFEHIQKCVRGVPKNSVALAIGFLKGKRAILIQRRISGKKRVSGLRLRARGYCVSTVGLDKEAIPKYIREQEKDEDDQEQLDLEFDN